MTKKVDGKKALARVLAMQAGQRLWLPPRKKVSKA